MKTQEILTRMKTPKMKRLLLVATATTALWAFSCNRQGAAHQKEIERIKTEFLQKEGKYLEEIKLLKIQANKFRFFEYDESGLKISEINKVKNAQLAVNPGDAFEKFRLREPKAADVMKQVEAWRKEHKRLGRAQRDSLDKKQAELLVQLEDSNDFYADEGYLRKVKEFRDMILQKTVRQAVRNGQGALKTAALMDKPDAELQEEIAEIPSIAKSERYGRHRYHIHEYERYHLLQDILKMREFVRYNNAMIDDIKLSYRQLFEAAKEPKINHMKDSAKKELKNVNYVKEINSWGKIPGLGR